MADKDVDKSKEEEASKVEPKPDEEMAIADESKESDPAPDEGKEPDPATKESKESDPAAEESKESDPAAEESKESDPAAEDTKDSDLAKEEPKDSDPAEETKESDPPIKEIKRRAQRNKLDPVPERTGKRQRKSAETYKPPDFTEAPKTPETQKGRGIKLKDIPELRSIIEDIPLQDPKRELFNAFRFLFPARAKVTPQDKKDRLLEFSGFLPPLEKNEDKVKREKADEDAEAKMAQKAYKLTVPEIKALCDFFCVDRTPGENEKNIDKDTLVDRLLDFLGSPAKDMVKVSAKKAVTTPAASKKAKGPVKSKPVKEEHDDDDDDEEIIEKKETGVEKGKMPSDKDLRKWVQAYVACFDLDKATTKHALQTASDKFGLDLGSKKARIKELLTEEM